MVMIARRLIGLPIFKPSYVIVALLLVAIIGVQRNNLRSPSFLYAAQRIGPTNGSWLLRRNNEVEPSSAAAAVNSSTEPPKLKLLGGLLNTAIDEASCLSHYQSALYWKASKHAPSHRLVKRLRRYEALHKRCGPKTTPYDKAVARLHSNQSSVDDADAGAGAAECKYLVWLPEGGLGNRMITIVSAFLYALLSDRVLLLGFPNNLQNIFCEPFPETSWILSADFPANILQGFDKASPQTYGNMLKNSNLTLTNATSTPAYVYINIMHDYTKSDQMFFCEREHKLLRKFPWLLLKSNQYFAPGLFLVSQYDRELSRLFPERQTVFHHLGRYLLHPANSVWGYITRYYEAYLANARERLGLQIRIFSKFETPFEFMLAQVMNCTLEQELLPSIHHNDTVVSAAPKRKRSRSSKAVLVTSLHNEFYETIRDMYYQHSTATGEVVAVYQPSHEEEQNSEGESHNAKALTEMYLLSFSDALVTTAYSTYGYVAQGLGGLRPWYLLWCGNTSAHCRRAASMEPCFFAAPSCDCETQGHVDRATVDGRVRHCDDLGGSGLKLFD